MGSCGGCADSVQLESQLHCWYFVNTQLVFVKKWRGAGCVKPEILLSAM